MNKLLAQAAPINIGKNFNSPFGQANTLSDLVSLVLKGSFVIAGILILFFMVFAGFQMIIGAGSNDPKAAEKGQQAASAAAIGFVIVFVAYWIVRIIEVITRVNFITGI